MSHRRLFFAVLVVAGLAATGCGSSVREKIVGTWVLDLEATKALPHFQAMPADQREAYYKNLDGMTMQVTFTQTTMTRESTVKAREGLAEMGQRLNGTFKVNKQSGNTLVLAVQTSEGMKRVGVELRGDQQLILDMDESKTVLKRK